MGDRILHYITGVPYWIAGFLILLTEGIEYFFLINPTELYCHGCFRYMR